jgi:hypothetical protein
MRFCGVLFVGFVASGLTACGPSWTVVRQASPNPFVGNRQWAIHPMDYRELRVGGGTEARHLSDKSPEQIASWEEDKAAIDGAFRRELTSEAGASLLAPGGAPFAIAPRITFIEPGFYAVVASRPAQVDLTLRILDARNAVLDEILFECTEGAGGTTVNGIPVTNLSSGDRLRNCGERLGGQVAEYLRARTGT